MFLIRLFFLDLKLLLRLCMSYIFQNVLLELSYVRFIEYRAYFLRRTYFYCLSLLVVFFIDEFLSSLHWRLCMFILYYLNRRVIFTLMYVLLIILFQVLLRLLCLVNLQLRVIYIRFFNFLTFLLLVSLLKPILLLLNPILFEVIHLISRYKLQRSYIMFWMNSFRVVFLFLAARVAITMRIIDILFGVSVGAISISVGRVIELVVEKCDILHKLYEIKSKSVPPSYNTDLLLQWCFI